MAQMLVTTYLLVFNLRTYYVPLVLLICHGGGDLKLTNAQASLRREPESTMEFGKRSGKSDIQPLDQKSVND